MDDLLGTVGLILLAIPLIRLALTWWRHQRAAKLATEGVRATAKITARGEGAETNGGVRRHPFSVAFHTSDGHPVEAEYTGPVGDFLPETDQEVFVRYSREDPNNFTVEGLPTWHWRPNMPAMAGTALLLIAGVVFPLVGFGVVPVPVAEGEYAWQARADWLFPLFPVLLGIWGVFSIADLVRASVTESRLRRSGHQAPGVVCDTWNESQRRNISFGFVQVGPISGSNIIRGLAFAVRFRLPDGREMTARCPQWADSSALQPGQEVTVLYRPEAPESFRVADVPDPNRWMRILQLLSALVLLYLIVWTAFF